MASITHISEYPAPRQNPLVHPGKRPPASYIFDGKENIFLLENLENGISQTYFESSEGKINVDHFLREQGVAALGQRIPVVGYGTNPCPGQLAYKFRSIGSRIVPVIKGTLQGWDTVYKFVCNPGYAYAQLIPAKDVQVEAWVTLLDQVQFEHMNITEGIFSDPKHYEVGILSNFTSDHGGLFPTIFYVGNTKIFLSPQCDGRKHTPISIAEIPAQGRMTPSLTQEEILNHCLQVFELENYLKEFFGQEWSPALESLGEKLAGFLNDHFNCHGGGGMTCSQCQEVLTHIFNLTEHQHCRLTSVADLPEIKGTLLKNPNESPLTLGEVWH